MKSSIKVDYIHTHEGLRPAIKVNIVTDSDDVRDKLIQDFFGELKHTSSWLSVKFEGAGIGPNTLIKEVTILPIAPEQMEVARTYMDDRIKLWNEENPSKSKDPDEDK